MKRKQLISKLQYWKNRTLKVQKASSECKRVKVAEADTGPLKLWAQLFKANDVVS